MTESENNTLALRLKDRLEDKKAQDVIMMDLRDHAAFADFFLVATGTSRTHVVSLAEEVDLFFHEQGIRILGMEGRPGATWVLVDAGNVVVHLFQRETREFYDLEKLWSLKSRPSMVATEAEALIS